MGFLNKIFKNKANINNASNNSNDSSFSTSTKQVINSLNLNKEESISSLNLRKDLISSICLDKKNRTNLTARVAVIMDYSYSMNEQYYNGEVQTLLDRLFPIALNLDDNGELDLWLFHNTPIRLESIRENNFYNYIKESKILQKYPMKGTEYAPVIYDVINKYIKEEPSSDPTLVIFITDGENKDLKETEKIIKLSAKYPIFWQFVGIGGNSNFSFLKSLDDMEGRIIDNANFFEVKNPMKINDKELYKKLLAEYPEWLSKARKQNILK